MGTSVQIPSTYIKSWAWSSAPTTPVLGGQETRRIIELTSPLSGSTFSERLSQDKAGRDKKAARCLPVASLYTSTELITIHTYTTHTAHPHAHVHMHPQCRFLSSRTKAMPGTEAQFRGRAQNQDAGKLYMLLKIIFIKLMFFILFNTAIGTC